MSDIEKPPSYRFRAENAGVTMGEIQPWHYRGNDQKSWFDLDKGWSILGWCENEELGVMARKEGGLIAVMFSTPDGEECWFHANKFFLKEIE